MEYEYKTTTGMGSRFDSSERPADPVKPEGPGWYLIGGCVGPDLSSANMFRPPKGEIQYWWWKRKLSSENSPEKAQQILSESSSKLSRKVAKQLDELRSKNSGYVNSHQTVIDVICEFVSSASRGYDALFEGKRIEQRVCKVSRYAPGTVSSILSKLTKDGVLYREKKQPLLGGRSTWFYRFTKSYVRDHFDATVEVDE